MQYSVDLINAKLRTGLKSRIGTQANLNAARNMASTQWKKDALSAGELCYALVCEAIYWSGSSQELASVPIPDNAINDNVVNGIQTICEKANSTHSNGSKAVAGAAVGSMFGWVGAAIGGIFGWAVGQNAANNDTSAIIMYANQAVDYLCDCICQQIKLIGNGTVKDTNNNNNKNISDDNCEKSVQTPKKDFPKFSDVIGLEEAKQAIQERIIEPAKHPDIYKKYGYKAGGGILLYGLPGTGKTMFAQAVANELDGKFFSVKASDLKAKWYGETEEKIKNLFAEARKEKVAVIFIDEFEAIGMDRNKATNDLTASTVVPELLAQMQGFEQDDKNILLVIAATNRPWDIDSALTRPGRLDYKVYVELPNLECRKAMLKNYLKKTSILESALDYLANHTEGYNGSDIKNVCDSMIKIVINKEISGVTNYHLDINDAISVLNKVKSSVSAQDVYLMEIFRGQK